MVKVLWLVLLIAARGISAVLTNYTVDDADPRIQWFGGDCLSCSGCTGFVAQKLGFDPQQLHNGTVSWYEPGGPGSGCADGGRALEFNFTGSALYVFFAERDVLPNSLQGLSFRVDGFRIPPTDFPSNSTGTVYNELGYHNTAMPDGNHSLTIVVGESDQMFLDYLIVSFDDGTPAPGPSNTLSSSSTQPSGPSISTSQTSSFPSTPASGGTQKGVPVGAIVGGVIGGIAIILAFVIGLIWSRRGKGTQPGSIEKALPPALNSQHGATPEENTFSADEIPTAATRLEILKEEVRRLEEQAGGSSTAGSDTMSTASVSVGRSLSTMKRHQTRALQNHQYGYARDSLVHTDSGLRLSAATDVDELPPTYLAD
ncbi:hypothetical protein C8R43DRAFT_1183883 [Mycena crocata]|nr:hypothetical protein C8R43DRAFT_1183883 [Mycena crocata]